MQLFSTRSIATTQSEGAFHCPQCERSEHFHRDRARRYIVFLSLPLFPVDAPMEFVECQGCSTTWEPGILDFDPERQQAELRDEWEKAVLGAMIRVMLADGRTEWAEVGKLRDVFRRFAERTLTEGELLAEIAIVEAREASLGDELRHFLPVLDEHGKEMVFRAALAVAAADGDLQSDERLLLAEIAEALQMSEAHVRGIFATAHSADEMTGEG